MNQTEQIISEERIAELESKLEATQYVLGQLLDGLFNKHTQMDVLKRHMDNLFLRIESEVPVREAPMIHVSPSTRQCDVLELRFKQMEEKMLLIQGENRMQKEVIANYEKRLLALEREKP